VPVRRTTAAVISRFGGIAALGLIVFAAAYLLFSDGQKYLVTAEFENASQLVTGNQVKVGGAPVGLVESIDLGEDGRALVKLSLDEGDYTPLHEGTVATIRADSLSGIAGRYVELYIPPTDAEGDEIDDGGTLGLDSTVSEVDVDQLFNTLDQRTIRDFKRVIRGFAAAYAGNAGRQANRSFEYLNPFVSTARRLFEELGRDRHSLERFVVDSAGLSRTLASRSEDTGLLVGNLDTLMTAVASRDDALREAIGGLPPFMREFNTAAVNLRAALDDLQPVVIEARPVAELLRPFMRRLRSFAVSSVPAIADLRSAVRRPGPGNDLVELIELQPALSEIGVGPVERNGERRRGTLPEAVDSLVDSLPILSFLRPYLTIEGVSGWFNTFSHPGLLDANGGFGRLTGAITPFGVLPNGLPNLLDPLSAGEIRDMLSIDNRRRCPGANERDNGDGSTPFTDGGSLDCDPAQLPVGP
jgi:phospholipid/cholesterol/gamma-HCH transport system substrate-binding protein